MAEETKKTMTPEQKLSLMFGRLAGDLLVEMSSENLSFKLDGHSVECPGGLDVLRTHDGSGVLVRSKALFFQKNAKGWAKVDAIPEASFRPPKPKKPAMTEDQRMKAIQALKDAGFSAEEADRMVKKVPAPKQQVK